MGAGIAKFFIHEKPNDSKVESLGLRFVKLWVSRIALMRVPDRAMGVPDRLILFQSSFRASRSRRTRMPTATVVNRKPTRPEISFPDKSGKVGEANGELANAARA